MPPLPSIKHTAHEYGTFHCMKTNTVVGEITGQQHNWPFEGVRAGKRKHNESKAQLQQQQRRQSQQQCQQQHQLQLQRQPKQWLR